ncbi:MAG: tRNA (N6-isopentenyl adenosine(37)-C2)-methylthiotransferase MiaB [Desulfovibrio sp.]|jgi:tRNA-2-methylthio-N6-dimethylallyladenosine synthase|nr:tRNA (N6-isopentenyl adenosine(37)-C2)-methylthiotransferase MiaB [Desulfovibrio sp.]
MLHKSFHIVTFGCQMNANDSRWLALSLEARGFARAEAVEAQVVVINTCSVREKPEQKVIAALNDVRRLTRANPDVLVVVAGCVAQQLGEALFSAGDQVRLLIGSDGLAHAPEAIERLLAEPELKLALLDFVDSCEERAPVSGASGPVAQVNIMQGCDNFCAYCIVPFTRGRQKSRPSSAVLEECRARLEEGAREICLLGQNVNAYGRDKHGDGTSFAGLLARVAALPGLARLRYVTPHPKDMSSEDVAAFGTLACLCPRLHLPVQSGSDAVLTRMGRKYGRRDFFNLVERLRKARPDIALGTDIIVGFPGESEKDFEDTLDMIKTCEFVSSFSFCYSDRPGARAALFPDKTAPAVSRERLARLQVMQDALTQRLLEERVGRKTDILIEGRSRRQNSGETSWQGRDPYGVPVHLVLSGDTDYTGKMAPVLITQAKKHTLMAQQAGEIW